jgi:hypothetical protein
MHEHRAGIEQLVQMAKCLVQTVHFVAFAVDQLHAAPGDAVRIGGIVRPAGQRKNGVDAGVAQLDEAHCVVAVADGDIVRDPVQVCLPGGGRAAPGKRASIPSVRAGVNGPNCLIRNLSEIVSLPHVKI